MGDNLTLSAEDGHSLGAYAALPSGSPRGGVVVIQEIFGVNAHIRSVVERFAAAGYAAIAPALFDRVEAGIELDYTPDGIARGRDVRAEIAVEDALKDIAAAAAALTRHGKVGVVGYCWGGSLAWLSATRLGMPSVGYYGGFIAQHKDEAPRAPVMLHFGETDGSIPVADVEAVKAAQPDVPIYLYPAGHGFICDARGDYHADSAKQAGERTMAFFAEHIG